MSEHTTQDNNCLSCDDERNGVYEKLNPIYYENQDGDTVRIEDSFYCRIHGIIIEDAGGNLRMMTHNKQEGDSVNG